jgi:hypothetical protein
VKKMMMAEVANHSKRNHTDSYFSGKAVVTTSSEEFGSMTPKKPRNTSPRTSPVSPKEKKDKIGERVAALQQLVSPFGKVFSSAIFRCISASIRHLFNLCNHVGFFSADGYGFCSAGGVRVHQVPAPATRGLTFSDRT